ncbi:MAG: antibiotic biosynthesis monooxygenase [Proteobacteria bacterium]|nr:antibiotic biosynthesis monooxygenase [Pseudomonadota bacterium]
MAVRIIIERKIKMGKEMDLARLLLELRSRAVKQKGYITGETLRDYDDPSTHIVISTWESAEDWKSWSNKVERMEVQSKIEELLSEPSKTKIYELIGATSG